MFKNYNVRIKDFRESFGLTQQQLADLVGGDVSQISRYENGIQLPPHEKLIRLAAIFHTTIEELLGIKKAEQRLTEDGKPMLDIKQGEVVRSQFFSTLHEETVTISPDGIQFSTACVRKWIDTEYIQIIIDEIQGLLIIRKGTKEDLDSQRWSRESIILPEMLVYGFALHIKIGGIAVDSVCQIEITRNHTTVVVEDWFVRKLVVLHRKVITRNGVIVLR